MRILVTGHQGYLGAIVVPRLLAEGHQVTGLDSGLFERCRFNGPVTPVPSIRRDVRDVLPADLQGIEAIVHLAGLSNDPLGDLNPDLTFQINHLATVRLARLAKSVGIPHFVFSSTCSVYGAAGEVWITEATLCRPVTPYGHSKARAEDDLRALADAEFSPIILRHATAYGVSPYLRFDLVLNNLVAWAATTGRVYLKSDGTAWRPIVHVEDIAQAFSCVLQAPVDAVHNRTFNVGRTEENYRIRDLAEIVTQVVPQSRVEFAEGARTDQRCYRVDCSELPRAVPGFRPHWNAEQGARQLYEAYRESALKLADFEGPRFKRIDYVKKLLESGELDTSMRWCNT